MESLRTHAEHSSWLRGTLLPGIAEVSRRIGNALDLPSESGLEGARFRQRQVMIAVAAIVVLWFVSPYVFHGGSGLPLVASHRLSP
jgi:hypothetical protein